MAMSKERAEHLKENLKIRKLAVTDRKSVV